MAKSDLAGNGSTSVKETYTNGGDGGTSNSNTIYPPVERALSHEPEVDLFAVATLSREVPPPSYVHVAAIAQRTNGTEFEGGYSTGMSSSMQGDVKYGYPGNGEKSGSSALFDGVVVSSVNEKGRFGERRAVVE
ncbi:hypothetical protein HDU76_004180 [Blyttiomyces sp. JEL0837]|nr:hypothetical protein HDU76_004180 [Blyttiomyces sp. JEL0837]